MITVNNKIIYLKENTIGFSNAFKSTRTKDNSYLSQLVPIFGQLVPDLWSTRTNPSQLVPILVILYLFWSSRTYFG